MFFVVSNMFANDSLLINMSYIRSQEQICNYTVTEEYRFSYPVVKSAFTEPDEHNSGDLMLVWYSHDLYKLNQGQDVSELLLFGGILSSPEVISAEHVAFSEYGKYVCSYEVDTNDFISYETFADFYSFNASSYKKIKSSVKNHAPLRINENGFYNSFYSLDQNRIFNIKTGERVRVYEDEMNIVDAGTSGCIAYYMNDIEARIFINDDISEGSDNVNSNEGVFFISRNDSVSHKYFAPEKTHHKFVTSESKDYVLICCNSETVLIDKRGKECARVQGNFCNAGFSIDEKLFFCSNSEEGMIVDINSGDVVELKGGGCLFLADSDSGIAAEIFEESLYIIDYRKSKLLFKDKLTTIKSWKHLDFNPNLQISGNGEEISVIFNNLYRKYRIVK